MATKVTGTDAVKATLAETQGVNQLLSANNLTLSSSLSQILPPLVRDPFVLNAFLTNIYNKLILTKIIGGRFENPLGRLKKGNVGNFGDTIEEIIMNPATATFYGDPDHNILASNPPDAKVQYLKTNRQDEYDVSLTRPQIMQAFTSDIGFSSFMDNAVNTLVNGDGIDEFELMKKIVSDMYAQDYLIKEVSETDPIAFTKQLINLSKIFKFPNTKYSMYSIRYPDEPIKTWVKPENIVIIIRADKRTDISVDVLSVAFNLSQIELTNNIIEVDAFTDANGDELPIDAIVCDEQYFQVHDTLYEFANFERADNLSVKTYLHHWQILTCSLFAKAVCLYHK